MIVNRWSLLRAAPSRDMLTHIASFKGFCHGFTEAGYDVWTGESVWLQFEDDKQAMQDQLLEVLGSTPKDFPNTYGLHSHGARTAWNKGLDHGVKILKGAVRAQKSGVT